MEQNDHKGTVGFAGLGTMGREMALNLLKAGYAVRAYDVRKEAVDDLLPHGAKGAGNLADAARDADIVISMLPDTPQVEDIVYGESGLLTSPLRGRLFVDMSTISPVAVRRIHADLKAAGVAFLDAPVSGGPVGARNASLSVMVGGDRDAFLRAEPYFRAMGTTITHMGEAGAGQTAKLCNQLVCAINLQAICEALALGRASGVDLDQLRNVLLGGSAASWMLEKLGPAMVAGDASAGFRIDLMLKDLRLVQEQAFSLHVPLPATALVTSQYVEARAHGEGTNGNQALFRVYDRMTNQTAA
ncbi:6-phosphogluconate dehydrogenase [Microvirga sp. KLBC 81]|nr:6-phosphogluconate dehydrogenase [Microvirga sp. KLBC 81]